MHKDVKKALEEAVLAIEDVDNMSLENAALAAVQTFLRNLPNHSDTVNSTGCWYPARILAELTEEKEGE